MWDYLLHRIFGIGTEGSHQVKLGAGVVYLTTAAFIAFCAAAGGISWALSKDPYLALAIAAIVALVLVVYLLGTWRFADKHPDQAALGGTSWLRLRELQIEAKNEPNFVPLPPTTDPQKPLPPTSTKLIGPPDVE